MSSQKVVRRRRRRHLEKLLIEERQVQGQQVKRKLTALH
jgi:hypothetical protein